MTAAVFNDAGARTFASWSEVGIIALQASLQDGRGNDLIVNWDQSHLKGLKKQLHHPMGSL